MASILRRLGFNDSKVVMGYTQFMINTIKVKKLVLSMGVSARDRRDRIDLPLDRVIDNALLRNPCAICQNTPDKLYPDKNEEYHICKECKQRG